MTFTKEELKEKEGLKNSIETRIRSNQIYRDEIREKEQLILETSKKLNVVKNLSLIVEGLALQKRNAYKSSIEAVVTEVLHTLYGKEYSFHLSYCLKNNRSCLEIEVRKTYDSGYTVRRDMSGHGGGVSDSVSIPLRLLILKGSPDVGDILFLDEAYKHVDLNMAETVGLFLKSLCEKMGMQIIMLSHHESILQQAETGFYLENREGKVYLRGQKG